MRELRGMDRGSVDQTISRIYSVGYSWSCLMTVARAMTPRVLLSRTKEPKRNKDVRLVEQQRGTKRNLPPLAHWLLIRQLFRSKQFIPRNFATNSCICVIYHRDMQVYNLMYPPLLHGPL